MDWTKKRVMSIYLEEINLHTLRDECPPWLKPLACCIAGPGWGALDPEAVSQLPNRSHGSSLVLGVPSVAVRCLHLLCCLAEVC